MSDSYYENAAFQEPLTPEMIWNCFDVVMFADVLKIAPTKLITADYHVVIQVLVYKYQLSEKEMGFDSRNNNCCKLVNEFLDCTGGLEMVIGGTGSSAGRYTETW